MSSVMIWTLKGIAGEFQGNTLPLKGPMMTVGRTHQNHIVIPDTNISRHHATFFVDNDHLFIQDEKSRNGIFLNDKKIEAGMKVSLRHNDRVMIGPHGFVIQVEEKAQTTGIQQAPTREMSSSPRSKDSTQFKPTTLLKPELLEKLKNFKLPDNMPKIQLNRRTLLYGIMGVFLLMVLITKLPKKSSAPSGKSKTTTTVEILSNSSASLGSLPEGDLEIDALKARAKAALQFQDYLAATQLYEKIALANPRDEYIKTQYEFSKKQLKRLIEKHLEFAKREYEKLNYERAIIEWKQVLALTLEMNPEVYQQTESKIRDAEREMQKRR
jgi:pSer/pThr/pTyr-binding forkhead associated (FHA) protein